MGALREIGEQTGLDRLNWVQAGLVLLAILAVVWGAWALLPPLGIAVLMNWEDINGSLRPAGTGPDDIFGTGVLGR